MARRLDTSEYIHHNHTARFAGRLLDEATYDLNKHALVVEVAVKVVRDTVTLEVETNDHRVITTTCEATGVREYKNGRIDRAIDIVKERLDA